jgi:hypothetical protein
MPAIFCRCFAEMVPKGMTFDQKWSQKGLKWSQKGAQNDQNGAKSEPKRAKGTYKGAPAEQHRFFMPKWCHRLVDFGSILAPF